MAKVALLGDLHWGARSDSLQILEYFGKFFQDIFFPELEKRGITHIIQCGDIVDRRKFININTAHEFHRYFTDPIIRQKLKLDIIIGNHDTFYKGTNKVNALNILYRNLPPELDIKYYSSPQEVIIDNTKFLFLPWICDDNYEESTNLVDRTDAPFLIGHLELYGFEMYKGYVATEGMPPMPFEKFRRVFSGHYHHISTKENITYVGTPYEIIWSDYNDPRGFFILDTDTGETEFIRNPYNLFHRIIYDEKQIDIKNFPYDRYKNSYIKIVVVNGKKAWMLDEFLNNLSKVDTIDVQVIDENIVDNMDAEIDIDQVEDTFSILNNYVDKIDILRKNIIKSELISLFNEATQISKE